MSSRSPSQPDSPAATPGEQTADTSREASRESPRRKSPKVPSRSLLPLGAAAAAGATLRLLRLDAQLPFGDELHAVRVVAAHPLRIILTTWFDSDPSPPLAALDELLIRAGGELDETALRLPSLLCGLAALVVLPFLIRARAPRLAAPLAWLVALAPALVLYSRIARPYMAVALLGFVSTQAFLVWWRRPSAGSAGLYLLSSVLALWLFVGAAPFVTAPFVFAALLKAVRPREGPRLRALASLGLLLLLGVALFLVPSRESFLELLRTKPGGSTLSIASVLDTLQLLAGARTPPPALLFWLLAFAGWIAIMKRDTPFALLSALAVAAQFVAMRALAPVGLDNAVVLERYLLVGLPLLLCWVAAGLVELGDLSRRRLGRLAGAAAAPAAVLALVLAGPFTDRALWTTSFLSSDEYVGFHAPRSRLPADAVPEIYHQLGASAQREAVLEYTGSPSWNHLNHLVAYQEIHRRRVLFAPQDDDLLFAEGIVMRSIVPPEPAAFLAAPARFLVVHRHTARELDRLQRPGALGLPPFGRAFRSRARLNAERMARRLERLWGPPYYSDDHVTAWDLAEVRAALAAAD